MAIADARAKVGDTPFHRAKRTPLNLRVPDLSVLEGAGFSCGVVRAAACAAPRRTSFSLHSPRFTAFLSR